MNANGFHSFFEILISEVSRISKLDKGMETLLRLFDESKNELERAELILDMVRNSRKEDSRTCE